MAVVGDLKKRGPYIFSIPYTVSGLQHEMTWQCDVVGAAEPGTLPVDITLRTRDGTGRTLSNAAAAFWLLAKFLIPTSAITAQYYLQRAQAGTDKLYYVSSGELGSAASGGAVAPSRQSTLTFRSALSGIARLVFLEGVVSAGDELNPLKAVEASADTFEKMAFFATSPQSPILAVDASWLVAPLTVASTQNEAIYNARNR